MSLTRAVLRHPIAILVCFALAFVVWLWRDSFSDNHPPDSESRVEGPGPDVPPAPSLNPDSKLSTPRGKKWRVPQESSADLLSKLKPGMTRVEVDDMIGTPAPQDVSPVTVADGKVTYQTAYDADLGSVPSIRPPQPPTKRDPKARTVVTLEFDATKPGHPLLSVHYPQPDPRD